jgi:hypothetical protein
MGALLKPPERELQRIQPTPVALAVKELVIRMQRYGDRTKQN